MPGRPRGRRVLRGVGWTLFTVLALVVLVHAGGWLWLTGMLTVGFSDWVAQQRARGWEVQHGLPERAGWPFAARLAVPDVRIAGWSPLAPQGFTWDTARLDLALAPPRLTHLAVSAEGPQQLRMGILAIPYTAQRLRAIVPLDPNGPPQPTEFLVEGLRAMAPDGPMTAARIAATLAPGQAGEEAGLRLHLAATRLGLPPTRPPHPFGETIEAVTADAVLLGPPSWPIPMSPAERAEAWRDAGGRVELRDAALRWGPLAGTLRMTLRLDAALQPVGSGRLVLERPAEALDALGAAGLVDPRGAAGVQVMLALMTRVPEGGSTPQVEMPVSVERGTILLARIPVLRLPPIMWRRGGARFP